jgi:hypothetical protein
LRSIAGHIVAGTVTDIERKQLDSILAVLEKYYGSQYSADEGQGH